MQEQMPLWAMDLKGDWFNFLTIAIDHTVKPSASFKDKVQLIDSPKQLLDLTKNKAIGAMKWWRKITACKKYPCFIYCPDERTLFQENGDYDWQYVEQLVREQGGDIDIFGRDIHKD